MIKPVCNLKFENLSFTFEEAKESVFENITFELPKSRAVWVRSPGGRGKSTLLRLLAGLITPQKGSYFIDGQDVSQMSFEDFLPYRLGMGYSFDFGGLINNKSIAENLLLPLLYHRLVDRKEAVERIAETLNLFGLEHCKDLRPSAIPGSQRKMTIVVRSFVNWPQVVFMDDPLTGLKQDNINDLIHYVEESFSMRGLRQIYFTSENPLLAQHFKAEELLISPDWFTSRTIESETAA
jgi:ABC-type transporter Mla maintaining outer membrane lipid asymmetry ATPase subunit MlaF